MKPEALDTFATQGLRPGTLEAAAADQDDVGQGKTKDKSNDTENVSS